MFKLKGFTLVELTVVVVVIGILAVVSIPIYRGYYERAMAAEAEALVGAVDSAMSIYYAKKGSWSGINFGATVRNRDLNLNIARNKYFKTFSVVPSNSAGSAWTMYAYGEGKAAGITVQADGKDNEGTNFSVYDSEGDMIKI